MPYAVLCALRVLCGSSFFGPARETLMPAPNRQVNNIPNTENHTRMELNTITAEIVDSAMRVHTNLGPGLLESAYQACLTHELRKRGLEVDVQVPLPLIYEGVYVEVGYRIDMLVEQQVIVENKAVRSCPPIY